MLASAVGGLLTRTLVRSQVECVTENACVYSFYMLMWLLCDLNAAKLFCCEFLHTLAAAPPACALRLWADLAAQRTAIRVWVGASDRHIWAMLYVQREYRQCQGYIMCQWK